MCDILFKEIQFITFAWMSKFIYYPHFESE